MLFQLPPSKASRIHFALLASIASFFVGSAASAKEVSLFQPNGSPRAEYVATLKELQPGDVLIFSDDSRYKISNLLGCGGTTCVFGLADRPGLALRIPSSDGYLDGDGPLIQEFIEQFIHGKNELRKNGVPSVEIHQFMSGEYVLVDRIEPVTRLDRFFANPFQFTETPRQRMVADLVDFATKTAPFESIGDFKADQLHYINGKGWMLVDWSNEHSLRRYSAENAFDFMFTDKQSPVRRFYSGVSKRAIFVQNVRRAVNKAILLKLSQNRIERCGLFIKRALFDLIH